MFKTIQNRLALSEKGARDFLRGTFCTTLLNIGIMLPAVYMFVFLNEYLRDAIDSAGGTLHGFGYYILLGLGFAAATWILAVVQYRSTFTTIYEESANRRISLAEKLRKLPLAFFATKNLSDLTSTIMRDSTDLEHTFSHAVPQLVASILSISLVAIGLFIYQWQLALALFWVVPVAASVVLVSKAWQKRNQRAIYKQMRVVSDQIQEGLDTIQEIKACQLENRFMNGLDDALDTYERQLTRFELSGGVLLGSAHSLLKLGLVSVILVGATLLTRSVIDVFTYLVFLLVASRIYEPVGEVFNNLAALFYLDARIDRMRELQAMPIQQGDTSFVPENYDIEFDDVSFSYEADKQVLSGVSFTAKQGEITALVGPSGGGKTTSAMLAARFWDAQQGRILLGGRDVREIDPETLLKSYSVVFQNVVLFNATIMDNIRIGSRNASDEEVLQAAKLARCDEFVREMSDGYDTMIGENGETLSGGERQRISIARALLKDAPIVLLDEATASLDVENETKIQAGLSELIRGKTVLIIAHRMRTVAHADKVVVISDGHVAEMGNPEQLMEAGGIFASMVQRQMTKS